MVHWIGLSSDNITAAAGERDRGKGEKRRSLRVGQWWAVDSNLGMGGGFASSGWSRARRGNGFLLGRWWCVPVSAVGWVVMGGHSF
jgi:hypothetical protein